MTEAEQGHQQELKHTDMGKKHERKFIKTAENGRDTGVTNGSQTLF